MNTPPTRPDDKADPTAESSATSLPAGPSVPAEALAAVAVELSGQFGRYNLLRRLGKGGMGRVYLAHDTHLDRLVALKVPHIGPDDPHHLRERFHREARAAANLSHPNIVPVYDVGAVGEVPYLTMAYIEGTSLQEWASAEPRPAEVVLAVVRKIALALEEAHQKGIVHRDLKPSNVLLDRRGEPVVMDFGLARQLDVTDETRLTSPGLLMGTPAYMSPEVVLGRPDCPETAGDVYSLGVMLYELLAGRLPFVGKASAILAQIVAELPEPPSRWRQEIDARLDALCMRAMARQPADRYPSMAAFAEALVDVRAAGPAAAPGPPADTPTAPLRRPPADARLGPRALELLRRWGCARALQKMRDRVQHTAAETQRATWQGLLDWMTGEKTPAAHAVRALQAAAECRALAGWALAGQASHLLRDRDYANAQQALDRADAQGDYGDLLLRATLAHTRAAVLVRLGRCDEALPHLHQALDLFGRDHFMTGRVLDTLGMAYAYKGSFAIAREFYQQSIHHKEAHADEAGIAISHGQLGRLYLDWGHLDAAEGHFQEDLRLARKLRSYSWSEAQIYNHLGQVAIARGEREAAAGRRAAARRHFATAAGWLDQSIRHSQAGKYPVPEGFARKDRAVVCLHEGDLEAAEEQVRLAGELFAASGFAEGTAKLHLVEGVLQRKRGRYHEAERRFRQALLHFDQTQEAIERVQAYREIARTLRDSGAAAPLVTRAYLEALAQAEASRHDPLVREIEQELHEVDLVAYQQHIYRRARGAGIDEDTPSLMEGSGEVATVLFIDLPGFAEFAQGMDPEAVLVTFNHLMADFAGVLSRQQAQVIAYRGNGLMVLARESRHAERAVHAALDLVGALEAFNRPRQILGLPRFHVRIGIASGDLLLGNVGTYHKMDFTAIGSAVSMAGALRNEARPGQPCISRGTWELVRDRFVYDEANPREVQVAGFGPVEVWDVQERRGRPARPG